MKRKSFISSVQCVREFASGGNAQIKQLKNVNKKEVGHAMGLHK